MPRRLSLRRRPRWDQVRQATALRELCALAGRRSRATHSRGSAVRPASRRSSSTMPRRSRSARHPSSHARACARETSSSGVGARAPQDRAASASPMNAPVHAPAPWSSHLGRSEAERDAAASTRRMNTWRTPSHARDPRVHHCGLRPSPPLMLRPVPQAWAQGANSSGRWRQFGQPRWPRRAPCCRTTRRPRRRPRRPRHPPCPRRRPHGPPRQR